MRCERDPFELDTQAPGNLQSAVKICLACVLIGFAALSAKGQVMNFGSAPPLTAEERAWEEAAIQAMVRSGGDLRALETLIASFPPEMFAQIGTNINEWPRDPVRAAAWKTLKTFYSTKFLEEVLSKGSDDAAYWALRIIPWQQMNQPTIGIVTADFLRQLIPALERLRKSKTQRTSMETGRFIAHEGLLADRQDFLESLKEKDEVILNKSLMNMIASVRVDPQITKEIWGILAQAKSENLQLTCLRYRWLFDLPAWDAQKAQLLAHFLETYRGGVGTNINTALTSLAMSKNPLAAEVLGSLAKTDSDMVKKRTAKYQDIYQAKHPDVHP
jgi:hypothetical protein